MKSFGLNAGPKQHNYDLPNVEKGASEEEVTRAPQIS